jgi:hypothetical protein
MNKMIIENWKAIEDVEKRVQEKTGDPDARFNASTYFIGNPKRRYLILGCMYRGKKGKKGQEKFTESYKEMMVYAKFCPFTGQPLYEECESESEETSKE